MTFLLRQITYLPSTSYLRGHIQQLAHTKSRGSYTMATVLGYGTRRRQNTIFSKLMLRLQILMRLREVPA